MKKVLAIIAAVVIIALAVMIWMPIPIRIEKTLPAVELRHGDAEHFQQRTITIDGSYAFYLYKEDTFTGRIRIDGYPETEDGQVSNLEISADSPTLLTYANVPGVLDMLGVTIVQGRFDKLFIGIYDDMGWDGDEGISLFAPAETREEALAIWRDLREKSEWLGAATW